MLQLYEWNTTGIEYLIFPLRNFQEIEVQVIVAILFNILTTSMNLTSWVLSCSMLKNEIKLSLDLAST